LRKVVGFVRQGSDSAYVVYKVGGIPRVMPSIDLRVLTLHHQSAGWRVIPNDDLAFDIGGQTITPLFGYP
jgi:hypothetical protein